MALTILQYPPTLSPVYTNYIPISVISDLATQSNFRYIFDVYEQDQETGDQTFKVRVNPYPRPDSTGLYSPHMVLRDILSYDVHPFITSATAASRSITNYIVNVGEEYNPGITFSDTYYSTGGLLGLTFSTNPGLLVDDVILIDVDNKNFNPQYDGTASVLQVDPPFGVTVNLYKGVDTTNEAGTITDKARISESSGTKAAFNASRQYEEKNVNFLTTWRIGLTSSNALTTYTSRTFFDNSWSTLSYLFDYTYFSLFPTGYVFVSNPTTPGLTFSYIPYGLTTSVQRIDIPTGYKNILGSSYSSVAQYIKTNDYDVYVVNWPDPNDYDTLTYLTGPFHYIYKEQCKEYDVIQVLFLNSLGAFEYFSFNLVSKTSVDVKRTTYRKVLDYNYSIGDRGETVLSMDITEKMILNSDWLNDDESFLLKGCITSPEVYLILNDELIPVIVEDNSYEVKTVLNDTLFQYKLTVSKANQIIPNI